MANFSVNCPFLFPNFAPTWWKKLGFQAATSSSMGTLVVIVEKIVEMKHKHNKIRCIMSNKISISFLFFSIFLIFSCNNSNTTCENLAKGDVCVIVKNRSGKLIKSVELKHSKKPYKIENLENNQNANISYNSPGESSYQIAVIFEDGKRIKSNGSYTEGGYTMTKIIHENKIETKFGTTY